jgi:hypothetical protein
MRPITAARTAPTPLPCLVRCRQFGTTSLGIHMKACKERWEVCGERRPRIRTYTLVH